jgi:hypothetical protein
MSNLKSIIDQNCNSADNAYLTLAQNKDFQKSREYVEELWAIFSESECVDNKFKRQIKDSFHQSFSEMYFTVLIQKLSFNIYSRDSGPDICFSNENMFIECVAPTDGKTNITNIDPSSSSTALVSLDDDLLISRYTASLCSKSKKFYDYIKSDGYPVNSNSINIIALNGSDISENRYNIGFPRIIKSLYPIGYPGIYRSGNEYIQYTSRKPSIKNFSGVEIPTDFFLKDNSSHISAVMYSEVCPFTNISPLDSIGSDIIMVHNPMAKNPLRKGLIKKGIEYSLLDEKTLEFEIINYK